MLLFEIWAMMIKVLFNDQKHMLQMGYTQKAYTRLIVEFE